MSFGFDTALYLTGEFPPVSSARDRPVMTRLQDFGGQSPWKQMVVRTVQFLVRFAPKTSNLLVVCDGTCTSITKVPPDLNTSIPVTGQTLDMLCENCL